MSLLIMSELGVAGQLSLRNLAMPIQEIMMVVRKRLKSLMLDLIIKCFGYRSMSYVIGGAAP